MRLVPSTRLWSRGRIVVRRRFNKQISDAVRRFEFIVILQQYAAAGSRKDCNN